MEQRPASVVNRALELREVTWENAYGYAAAKLSEDCSAGALNTVSTMAPVEGSSKAFLKCYFAACQSQGDRPYLQVRRMGWYASCSDIQRVCSA